MVRQSDIDDAQKDDNKLKKEDKGIKWERSCTDCLCCMVFLAFLVAMVGCSFLAITKGDPERMLTPFDSDGNRCGMPDQCSSNNGGAYAFPQGTACPDTHTYEGETAATTIVKRDFTLFPFKYFPLTEPTSLGILNSVCVKACPGGTAYAAPA